MSYYPSFKKELNRLYCVRWLAQNECGREHISWGSKLKVRKELERLPINLPKIYQVGELDDLTEPKLNEWVLKPDRGAANRGVFPVKREGKQLINKFSGNPTTWKKIIFEARKLNGFRPPFYIEEYLGSEQIPYNWELYCFDGDIGLIRQRQNIDQTIKLYKFWSADFEDLGLIEESKKDILKPDLPPPINQDELIETAKIISKNIPYVFCRIDLYDTPKGVYYGELTPHPGIGNNFNPEIDKKLGRMWLKAEARKV